MPTKESECQHDFTIDMNLINILLDGFVKPDKTHTLYDRISIVLSKYQELQQENNQLKQLKERIEDPEVKQVLQETIEDYYLSISNLKLSKEVTDAIVRKCEKLQQLLKGDSN